MTLEAFGWSPSWQAAFAARGASGLMPGRVVGEHRTHLQVATEAGEVAAEIPGRLRNAAQQRSDLPGVGDFVSLRLAAGDGPATIEDVLPRTSALVRKASGENRPQLLAANVDFVFIVTAPDGDFNLPRIERFVALVLESGAAPVIVLNKTDLTDDVSKVMQEISTVASGAPVHGVSAHAHTTSALELYFAGNRTIGLIGSSGVGKSTLTNTLLGRAAQATQAVRAHDSRGRHTTTHRQLFLRPAGGSIMDTPGMRGIETWNPDQEPANKFEDIETVALGCKFSNCRHESEPKCAVRAAVARGDLDAERVAKYVALARA
ncbi:MAG: ribosome small subunit-dependent GTPase A [Hyphomicrobium sp.]|jgi:ribosome biogenesis GTPase